MDHDTTVKNDKLPEKIHHLNDLFVFGLERINQDSAVNLLEKFFPVFKIRELVQSIT